MHLTHYTNYALRVLMYLAVVEHPVRIAEIADHHQISRHHLVKIVHRLSQENYVRTKQGRNGGIELARAPQDITVGEIVRFAEDNLALVECFGEVETPCKLKPICRLRMVFFRAHEAFMRELDAVSIADISANPEEIIQALSIPVPGMGGCAGGYDVRGESPLAGQ